MGVLVSFQKKPAVTLTGTGPTTFPLDNAVNRSNCWLVAHGRGVSSSQTDSEFSCYINSAGTGLVAERVSASGGSIIFSYWILEHTSIAAQWLEVSLSTASLNTTIASVDMSRTLAQLNGFVTYDGAFGRYNATKFKLTTSTNLLAERNTGTSPATRYRVNVVEFGSDIVSSVAYYEFTPTTTNYDATITSVDTSKAMAVSAGAIVAASSLSIGEISTFGITGSTTLNFANYTATSTVTYGVNVVNFINMPVTSQSLLTTSSATPTISAGAAPTHGAIMIGGAYGLTSADEYNSFATNSFSADLSGSAWTLTRNTAAASKVYTATFDFAALSSAATKRPSPLQNLFSQFAAYAATRLGGVLQ